MRHLIWQANDYNLDGYGDRYRLIICIDDHRNSLKSHVYWLNMETKALNIVQITFSWNRQSFLFLRIHHMTVFSSHWVLIIWNNRFILLNRYWINVIESNVCLTDLPVYKVVLHGTNYWQSHDQALLIVVVDVCGMFFSYTFPTLAAFSRQFDPFHLKLETSWYSLVQYTAFNTNFNSKCVVRILNYR